MSKNIYIIGMPGSGKSTWGKRLANAIHFSFIDLDNIIETKEKYSIENIFKNKGEDYFRKTEQETLHYTAKLNNTVIACGGGTPCFFDNIDWINKHGKSIYFKANDALLFDRILKSKTPRPLLLGTKSEDLQQKIKNILSQREQFYMQANTVVNLPIKSIQSLIYQAC